jgi:tetratricopeptide (TPR) repeat protein
VLARLWNRLRGYERLKERADHLFLAGDFERARRGYQNARSIVADADHRAGALDSLIESCDRQSIEAPFVLPRAGFVPPPDEDEIAAPALEDLFELAIAEKPAPRAEAYRILGPSFRAAYVALLQGRAERAVALFERASAEAPSSFVVQLELARALSLLGDVARARAVLDVADRLAPEDEEARLLSAAVSIELGRFQDARARLLPLLERGDAAPEVLFLSGKALAGLGRVDEALARFRETATLEPHFHEAYFEAGGLMKLRGDVDAAFRLWNRASSLAPDEVRYNRDLASLVLAHRLDEEAGLAACDRLMVIDEENRWQYLHWVAELYIRRGWRREARDPLQKALELLPHERRRERHQIEELLSSLQNT